MKNKCEQMETLITAYIDQELEKKAAANVEDHLEACAPCRERYEAEAEVKRMLRERVQPVSAPPELRARIRRRLQRDTQANRSVWEALRSYFALRPAASIAVAIALLVLVIVPSYLAFVHNPFTEGAQVASAEGQVVDLFGEIVCVDCAVMLRAHVSDESTIARVKQEHDRGLHHPGLMTAKGEIYNFLHTGKGLELLQVPSHGGEKVKIHGVVFPQSRLIEVRSYQII